MSDAAVLSLLAQQHEQLLAEIAALRADIATVMGIVSRMDPKLAAMLTQSGPNHRKLPDTSGRPSAFKPVSSSKEAVPTPIYDNGRACRPRCAPSCYWDVRRYRG